MKILYSTKVTPVGGRSGRMHSSDDLLDLQLALPHELGGKGGATNPEQLFCGGYSACFENAILHYSRIAKVPLKDDDVEVVGEVGLSRNEAGSFVLAVALAVTISGVDQATADMLVKGGDSICPYSNAIRGNVAVGITVSVR